MYTNQRVTESATLRFDIYRFIYTMPLTTHWHRQNHFSSLCDRYIVNQLESYSAEFHFEKWFLDMLVRGIGFIPFSLSHIYNIQQRHF